MQVQEEQPEAGVGTPGFSLAASSTLCVLRNTLPGLEAERQLALGRPLAAQQPDNRASIPTSNRPGGYWLVRPDAHSPSRGATFAGNRDTAADSTAGAATPSGDVDDDEAKRTLDLTTAVDVSALVIVMGAGLHGCPHC